MENRTTISVKPDKIRLINLLEQVAAGQICIPVFQRDFVWKKDQMKELFDSISKGYPIGSLLFWKPGRAYKSLSQIGPYEVPPQSKYYVLDGFQRLSTLFGVLSNPKSYSKNEGDIRDFLIYYNLETKEFDFIKSRKIPNLTHIPLYKVIDTFEYLDFIQDIRDSGLDLSSQTNLIKNAQEINKIFLDYHIPYVEINGGDIKSAVDIFSRTNSTGTEISEDFMLSALSYNDDTGFLLSESISEFLNRLDRYNFEDLKRDTVLNCIATAKGRLYFDIRIEDLIDHQLESLANGAFNHIEAAVGFLFKHLNVLSLSLLPYPTQLVFLSEFFRLNPTPSSEELEKLKRWFWFTTYSNYFTLYSLSQQRSAYTVFQDFARGNHESGIYKVEEESKFSTAKFPDRLNFTGVRPKALYLFYLKSIVGPSEINDREAVKEIFITPKNRRPSNILLRLTSEFETWPGRKDVKSFIATSSRGVLARHFIEDEMVTDFLNDRTDRFLDARESLLKTAECSFVEELGIRYVSEDYRFGIS